MYKHCSNSYKQQLSFKHFLLHAFVFASSKYVQMMSSAQVCAESVTLTEGVNRFPELEIPISQGTHLSSDVSPSIYHACLYYAPVPVAVDVFAIFLLHQGHSPSVLLQQDGSPQHFAESSK
jgi:hypothetical protein